MFGLAVLAVTWFIHHWLYISIPLGLLTLAFVALFVADARKSPNGSATERLACGAETCDCDAFIFSGHLDKSGMRPGPRRCQCGHIENVHRRTPG
jgi:hypothetical protein